jgi:hypothetical protein
MRLLINRYRLLCIMLMFLTAIAGGATILPGEALSRSPKAQVHFVPNTFKFWNNPKFATTELPGCTGDNCTPTPAYADILLSGSNFVQ